MEPIEKNTEETPKEALSPVTVEEALARLAELEGLEQVKKEVREFVGILKMNELRRQRNLPVEDISCHMVFMGSAGTGKTTVARIMADIFRALGILKKGQLVETNRSELVGQYVGQTAYKTKEKIDEAMGGVLLIDEAYTLNKGGFDFGQEAIDTILKEMEDRRGEFVVILSGDEGNMQKFLSAVPYFGLHCVGKLHFTD